MQDVTITFTRGPLKGSTFEFEVGEVAIGRLPGSGGLELKNADTNVSRHHADLREVDGAIRLDNLSPNGTRVDGALVLDTTIVKPGAEIAIGDNYVFRIDWVTFTSRDETDDEDGDKKRDAAPGPLASPVVRAIIVFYLLAMVGLAFWLTGVDKGDGIATDDWPQLREAYSAYIDGNGTAGMSPEALARTQVLMRKMRAYKTQGDYAAVAPICREIMSLDNDVGSPVFQYGVDCLAWANSEGL